MRWHGSRRRRWGALLLGLIMALSGCTSREAAARAATAKQAQADAELLGREVLEIVDRVMAYRTSHAGRIPASLKQAGLDSLATQFTRRLRRAGDEPLVTIAFRRGEGHTLTSCEGTSLVLEDQALRAGAFDVSCRFPDGRTQDFTVPPPPPPRKE